MSGIAKRFGKLQALDGVDLDLHGGEVHALLGENGAGKSTLMNVLYGLTQPDRGEMRLDGEVIRPRDPAESRRLGFGMVHQHFTVVAPLTTAENFALGLLDAGFRYDPRRAAERARELAARFGLDIGDPDRPTGELSVGARQRIEILKALAGEARILILDEPTAVLTPQEVEQLFEVLRNLRREGRLVVFITHKLDEVRAIADRVSVLRRGAIVGGGRMEELSDDDLAMRMVGRSTRVEPPQRHVREDDVLRLDAAVLVSGAPPTTFRVRAGEVLGIVGVDGNGQDEIFEVLAGLRPPESGTVEVKGVPLESFDPAAVQEAGIGVIPPDRRADGLVAEMPVRDNLLLSRKLLSRFSTRGVLHRDRIRAFALALARRYHVRESALPAEAGTLSGGNQQRVVVARALAGEPSLLLAVNPTRGLDIAAARAVYDAMEEFVAAGNAVVLVSTDLDEAMEMSDRIGVLFRGRLSALQRPPYSLEQIGLLMAGSSEAD